MFSAPLASLYICRALQGVRGEWGHKKTQQHHPTLPRDTERLRQTQRVSQVLMTHSSSWEFLGPIASNLQMVLAQFLFSFFFSHTGHSSSS